MKARKGCSRWYALRRGVSTEKLNNQIKRDKHTHAFEHGIGKIISQSGF